MTTGDTVWDSSRTVNFTEQFSRAGDTTA
jgi:hypothetical protein